MNRSLSQCPYEDWDRVSISICNPSEYFHCLQDEFGRIGWLCTQPIWVEKSRCPVYDIGAKMLDSIFCNTTNCSLGNYKSNYVYRGNSSREIPTSEQDGGEGINLSLLMDTSNDTFTRARSCLATKRFVVLRGVQGSGKTYLAKKLADNINQISNTKCQVHWIHDVLENGIPRLTNKALFVLDDMFYELQSKDEIQGLIEKVKELFDNVCSSKRFYAIVTIPTLTWKIHSDYFQNETYFTNYVDLDTLNTEERLEIFNQHLNRSALKKEGDPTKMQNQMDLHDARRFIEVPITRIKSEISRLLDSKNTKQRKMFTLLAFMAFNNGKLNVREYDEDLLMEFARIFFPFDNCREFTLQENDPSVFSLQEKYIRHVSDGIYEFYLDIVRKIVLVISLGKNFESLKKYVSQDMLKCIVLERGKFHLI
ncbi:uncharacterized protein LOC134255525 [Saccostrea cucullata]|uniref:uncharacterized protein LOC134255525 n=1 Tax=Saccostrea cuccullata TaxID=36930 RepID=UPI002ED1B13F